MVIIKNKSDEKDNVSYSSSTKVGRANSRDVRLRRREPVAPFKTEEGAGSIASLTSDGKMVAPKAKEKKDKKKSIFALAKEAKKKKK